VSNPNGRPPKYKTPEDMQKVIDAYFSECEAIDRPFTMSGLAYALGMSRRALCDYAEKDDFLHTVKSARQRVETFLEERLYESAPAGAIFNLKNNFGWKDATQTEHTGSIQIEAIERRVVKP
jgi:hypothetical protein